MIDKITVCVDFSSQNVGKIRLESSEVCVQENIKSVNQTVVKAI